MSHVVTNFLDGALENEIRGIRLTSQEINFLFASHL